VVLRFGSGVEVRPSKSVANHPLGVKAQPYLNDLLLRPPWRIERAHGGFVRLSTFVAARNDARSASFAVRVDGNPWYLEFWLVFIFPTELIYVFSRTILI